MKAQVPSTQREAGRLWDESFEQQARLQAYNTAPVEALARTLAYYLRERYPAGDVAHLCFLEIGCGAGANLVWLARRGIRVSGIDISPTALDMASATLTEAGYAEQMVGLTVASASHVPFHDDSFDGIVEACVFQHLARGDRERAFAEVRRLLRPGGVFVGYMLDRAHTVFRARATAQIRDDPGTLVLNEGSDKIRLEGIGLSHFFSSEEIAEYLAGFSVVDPCLVTYRIPSEEANRRGFDEYVQSMWNVYAVK